MPRPPGRITAEAPLILVLEDLHWSDAATLDALAMLAGRREPARLLVLGTYRPVEVIVSGHPLKGVKQELALHGHCAELALEGLSEGAVAEYLAVRFPGGDWRELARVIHRRTEGQPLFMVNVGKETHGARDADRAGRAVGMEGEYGGGRGGSPRKLAVDDRGAL